MGFVAHYEHNGDGFLSFTKHGIARISRCTFIATRFHTARHSRVSTRSGHSDIKHLAHGSSACAI